MHNNKFIQVLLKNLLHHGIKAIRKRSIQNESDPIDQAIESQIIKIFSQLLDEDYDRNTFKQEILKKRLPSKPNAKKIIQLLYIFIYIVEISGKKINDDQIKLMSQDIISMINKLNNRSRFFHFKLHLRTKVIQLTKIKKLYFSASSKIEIKNKSDIKEYINSFKEENTLNIQGAIKVLEFLNKSIALISQTSTIDSLLEIFFENLYNKCQNFINDKKYIESSDQINIGIKNIISEINILSGQLDSTKNISSFNKCLDSCKRLRYLSKSSKEKFNENEKNRENQAYSFESFQKILSLNQSTINEANLLLKQNSFKENISNNLLSKYNNILSQRNIKLLDKKFYDKQVENMKSDVKEAIEKSVSKSMFGKRTPTSNQILDRIANLF